MPDLHSLTLYLLAGFALAITPGPDMLYVAARSAGEGRAAGVASALGIATGTLVHIALVAGGLVAMLSAVPAAYFAIRIAGALYLIYLGVRMLMSKQAPLLAQLEPASRSAIFRQGVITNVLNPKVALFFLAFLPQFVDPARGSAALQVIFLGLLSVAMGVGANLLLAFVSSGAANRLRRSPEHATAMQRFTGGVFIALGLRIAWSVRT